MPSHQACPALPHYSSSRLCSSYVTYINVQINSNVRQCCAQTVLSACLLFCLSACLSPCLSACLSACLLLQERHMAAAERAAVTESCLRSEITGLQEALQTAQAPRCFSPGFPALAPLLYVVYCLNALCVSSLIQLLHVVQCILCVVDVSKA